MKMDWVHCNSCFLQPNIEVDILKFIITNCGHLFCRRCAEKMRGKCMQCRSDCRTMGISKDMDPSIAVYFRSLEDYFQKLSTLQKETTTLWSSFAKAHSFQESQRRNLVSHLKRKASAPSNGASRSEEIEQMRQRIASDQQTIAKLQQEHDRLMTIISNSLHKRPASGARSQTTDPGGHPPTKMDVSPSVSMISLAPSIPDARRTTNPVRTGSVLPRKDPPMRAPTAIPTDPRVASRMFAAQAKPAPPAASHVSMSTSGKSCVSGTSSRIVSGPTYSANRALVAKRYKF
ncbi:probable E3 SUMO-protein ligase RNF212 isoform X2 [Paramacrobiotus metropolitanus]|uniref:probable E3 SUMO-protein ligase RNF212 isoform X2 n=1 Tax=Paramacrobiotus metropolitanus TaxID=2943436 RepID=UPI0024462914|nr:probable E3 SUMO-protein ligase RNF212 isoform X2 [Paramacrobiotus metropolitanus]